MNSLLQEKRKFERFNTAIKVLYRNSENINTAMLKNISMNGMLLHSSEALTAYTILTITLSVAGITANSPKIAAKVLWCKELKDNGWLIGTGLITNFSQSARFMTDIFASQNRSNN
ncbi:MAG: PilZ domain-containing protein [bacterium]|nr:PilZ domain-containing protein [bacterium]MDD5354549.1 PilZ domain-containing protein [bacterium]